MSFKAINSRQILNSAALPNIGTPANDTLDDILAKINDAISGGGTGGGYDAKKVSLTSGTTSQVVTVTAQPDTSYIVLAIMGNTTDTYPQYQQVEVTNKTVDGFTFSWNQPLDSNNYFISFIVPFKTFPEAEVSIGSSVSSVSATLPTQQPFSAYPVIAQLQNLTDATPQFQSIVVGSNSGTTVNTSFNVITDSANYIQTYGILATGQASISSSASSVTVNLPVNFGSTGYAAVASIQNTVDSHPQYQPMIVKAETASSVTFGWNIPRDTANYIINYYVISLTP